ncbi:hypothetical protein AYI68_g4984 [Smittium mucronatum]|uniref:Uncharacterized protein n=1 Tax=Smittium mucronatum TaxID=133383 RepID=A0A1R0GVI8_9FUNG|nr:hypothetical protein AYI68_g4984 [Smittium mucronatum]
MKEKGTYENLSEVNGRAERAQGDTLYHDILLSIKEDPKINKYESLKNNRITTPEVKETTNIADRSDRSENDTKYISKLPIIGNENEIESEDKPRRKQSSYLDRDLFEESNVRKPLNERDKVTLHKFSMLERKLSKSKINYNNNNNKQKNKKSEYSKKNTYMLGTSPETKEDVNILQTDTKTDLDNPNSFGDSM